jgi:hypothetical protein
MISTRWRSPTDSACTRRAGRPAARTFATPLDPRDSAPVARTGQRERDVLGDGQRLEQREVLEHHADAELARVRRISDRDGSPSQSISPRSAA